MGEFEEVTLNQWLRALPVQVAMAHTGLSREEIERIPVKTQDMLG